MQLTYHQEEILRRFDAARELLDATYDRLPPYFHEIDVDPIQYTLRNWENLRQFRNREKHRPIVPYDNDGHSGPPPDRHTVLEALYLLMIMHNAYAMLHAPRNPHPALPSTQNWTKHQAVMGILGSPTRPIMKMASGPNGVLDILRWFPFMSMTRGPYPMSMADGSALHDFGDMENWPPSPAAICHFHCCKVTELQRTIMMLDEQLVSIPAFCLWCSAQTVIYRLLLSSLTVIKVINEAILEGKQMTVSEATNAVLADINLHTDLMEKLSKRWPAAMAAFIMTKHIVARALEGSMQEDHDALFTTVGIISEPGQAKVDNLIGRMDELEIGGMKLDQPPAPKKTHVASVSPAGSGSSRRGSVLGDVAGSIDSLPPIAELKPSSYSDSSTRKPQRGPVPTSGPVAAAAPPQPNMHSMPGPEPRSQITNFVDPKGYSGPTFGANNGLASEAAKGQLHQSSGSQMAAPFLHLHLGQHPHLSNSLRLSQVTSIVSTPSFSGGSSAGQGQTDRFAGNTRDLFGELDAVPATGSPIIPGIVANAASLKPRPPFGNVIIDTAQLSRPVPNSEELLAYSAAMFKQQQEQARRAFNK